MLLQASILPCLCKSRFSSVMIFLERFVPLRQKKKKKIVLEVKWCIYAVRIKRVYNAYYHLNVLVVDIRIRYKYFVHLSFVVRRRMLQVYIDPLRSKNTSSASDNLFSWENCTNHAKCKTRRFTSGWTRIAAFIKYFKNIFSNHLLFNLQLYFLFLITITKEDLNRYNFVIRVAHVRIT